MGQEDKDEKPPTYLQNVQGAQIGNNNRQRNFITNLLDPGPGGSGPGGRPPAPAEVESPYRGLLAFREQDAAFFFGQDTAAEEILNRLQALTDTPALMVVSGVSGAGKSSLLRAGVLPHLGEITPRDASWPHLTLTPASSPLSELAACAARRTSKDAATLLQTLRDNPGGFALTALEAAGRAEDGGTRRLVLVVDQFEQVFTRCADENERRAFITALHAAATVGHGPRQVPAAMVILVVRADFEARCASYKELVDAIQNRYLLPPMTEEQLRLAITEPARVSGTPVDNALVSKLIDSIRTTAPQGIAEGVDVGTGVLPHLSHALDQAWRHRAGNSLTLDDYARTGGLEGSIAASADQAYALLTSTQQATAQQVFIRLTASSDSGDDTGDRASIADLTEGKDPAEAADVRAVLEAFADQRLLTKTADSVELSHEALLTAWPLLRDTWLAETRADRIVRTQLRTAAARWDDHDRNPSYLYRGTQLAALRDAAARWSADPARYPVLVGAERDFLRASSQVARRATVQRRIIASALVLLLVASLTATGIAINAAGTARQQTAFAASGQLAAQSKTADSADPATAALLAAASWRIDPGNSSALERLLDVYARPDHATLKTNDGQVYDVAYSRSGKMLATVGDDGKVRLWDIATHAQIGTPITGPDSSNGYVNGVAFSPDGQTLATADADGTVRLWNTATHAQIGTPITVPDSKGYVYGVAYSHNGKMLATIGHDRSVRLWDIATHAQIGTPITGPGTGSSVDGVAFSPDGQTLATASADATVRLWNTATHAQIGTPITVPGTGSAVVYGMVFSPDGQTVATADADGTVRLWDIAIYHQIGGPITVPGRGSDIPEVAYSHSGKMFATVGRDGAVRLWDVATRAQIGTPIATPGSSISEMGVAFSPDGRTLATADADGTVRLWNTATHAQIGAPHFIINNVDGLTFSPDGRTLASAGGDGTVRVWNAATHAQIGTPITVPDSKGYVYGVAYSPDGRTLATAGGDATVRFWDVATRAQIGTPITVPSSSSQGVHRVAFSPDGRTLASTGGDGTVRLWDVAFPTNLVKAACTIAGRSLSRQEWKNYVPSEPFQQVCPAG